MNHNMGRYGELVTHLSASASESVDQTGLTEGTGEDFALAYPF